MPSATLREINASGSRNDKIIRTFEIVSDAWPSAQLICNGFDEQVCVTEDGRTLTFIGTNASIALPRKDNKGAQSLAVAIPNGMGEVTQLADAAIAANARVTLVYRTYLESNRLAPQERPYRLTLLGATFKGMVAQLQTGYFNAISTAWPRDFLTADFAPGLRYIL